MCRRRNLLNNQSRVRHDALMPAYVVVTRKQHQYPIIRIIIINKKHKTEPEREDFQSKGN